MERSNPFDYEAEDDDTEAPAVEQAPPSLGEKFKEFFENLTDPETDKDDEESSKKKKKKKSSILSFDDTEESVPEVPESEPMFALPFIRTEVEEPAVETPTIIEPEAAPATEAQPDSEPESELPMYQPQPQQTHAEQAPVGDEEDDPVTPVTPPVSTSTTATSTSAAARPTASPARTTSGGGGPTPSATPTPTGGGGPPFGGAPNFGGAAFNFNAMPQANQANMAPNPNNNPNNYATRPEAKGYAAVAGIVGVGAAVIANSRAKSREGKLEHRSEKRDKALDKKIETQREAFEARQARMQQQLEKQETREEQRAKIEPEPVVQYVERSRAQPEPKAEKPRTVDNVIEAKPQQETYSPDVHDRAPARDGFESPADSIEQPLPQAVEQQRRFEVKDDPTKLPVSYTQADFTAPRPQPTTPAPQAPTGNDYIGPTHTPLSSAPKKTPSAMHQTYQTAIISGVVTAAVLLAAVLAIALLSQ